MPNTEASKSIINPSTIAEDYIHVVAAIIWRRRHRQQFLITQRQKGKHLEDYWEFPGGKLETKESPWQGLQRELLEEVNIQPKRAERFMQVYHRYPERNILLDTWSVDDYQGEIEPREQQAILWIDIIQADHYSFPPADIPILEAIRNSARAGTERLP